MPRPWRPPMALASMTRSTAVANVLPLMPTGRPCSKVIRHVLGGDLHARVPEPDAHDRLDDLDADVEVLQFLGLVGGPPDVGVGGVGLLLGVAVGQGAFGQPLGHLRASAELADEVGVQPRLVDPQLRVGQQAVAVEPLDVVALVGGAVAPDPDVVLAHGAHQHGAGDGASDRGGVEVGASAGADVEGAADQRDQALLDHGRAAVDHAGQLGAVLAGAAGDGSDVRLVVLAEVSGVGAGNGTLLAHPGDGHGRVQASGEGEADAFADGKFGEDLGHGGDLIGPARRPCPHPSRWAATARHCRARQLAEGQPRRRGPSSSRWL